MEHSYIRHKTPEWNRNGGQMNLNFFYINKRPMLHHSRCYVVSSFVHFNENVDRERYFKYQMSK